MPAPSGVFATLGTVTSDSAVISAEIGSYGDDSLDPSQYIEVAVLESRNYQAPSITSRLEGSADLTYSATLSESQTLKLTPNTKYYYAAQASNGTEVTTSTIGDFVTSPLPAVIRWVDEIILTDSWTIKAKIAFTQTLGGGAKTVKTYYRYSFDDGATWENNWTLIAQNTSQGFFYIDGLPFSQRVLVQTYTQGARTSVYNDTAFTTQDEPEMGLSLEYNSVLDSPVKGDSLAWIMILRAEPLRHPDGLNFRVTATAAQSQKDIASFNISNLHADGRSFLMGRGSLPSGTMPSDTYTYTIKYITVNPPVIGTGSGQLHRPYLGVTKNSIGEESIITDIAEVPAGESLTSDKLDIRYDRFIAK